MVKILLGAGLLGLLLVFPLLGFSTYVLHIATLIFIWSFIATAWSYMGRFGVVSLGHGAFLGIGAYTAGLLLNSVGLSPWLGLALGGLAAAALAWVIGQACFRFGVIGDYFALVTLALGEVVSLVIVALRDHTGGSLGVTVKRLPPSLWNMTFADKTNFYYLALLFLLGALAVWKLIDRSRLQKALRAIGEDEIAASTLGVRIVAAKIKVTMISAAATAVGGVLYGQYVTYLNPHTLAGTAPSLDLAFRVILGGMFSLLGPSVGTALILILEEYIRVVYGTKFIGLSQVAYGVALVLLIMFFPKGLLGGLEELLKKRRARLERAKPAAPRP